MILSQAKLVQFGLVAAVVASLGAGGWWVWHATLEPALIAAPSPSDANSSSEKVGANGSRNRQARGPVAVEVADARGAKSSNDIQAIGSLQSDESVVLAPEVSGRISEISFEEGKPVKKGAALVKLDDALVSAEVTDAKARLTLASANNDRARTLAKTGTVTGRGRDEAVANFETAEAAVALAETKLAKLVLRAPFDGVAGLRRVSAGAFVNAGAPVVNLEKIDALKVDFKIPETFLQAIKVGQRIELTVDAIVGRTFDGEIYAINPLVDVNGRALQIRARLSNQEQILRPGLFARIVIKGLIERDVVVVPESAVLPRGESTFVFVVVNGRAVETQVKLGQRSNAEVEVLDGLRADAIIVVAGQQKLRNGAAVEVVLSTQPRGGSGAVESDRPATSRRNG